LRERFAVSLPERGDGRGLRRAARETDIDAVVVATPVPTHFALAKQALEAGKHVFVEKPPAMRASEMEELSSHWRRNAISC